MLRNITRYNEQKERKRVSLNEEKFLAEQKAERREAKKRRSSKSRTIPIARS